jgi:hypothetical protein
MAAIKGTLMHTLDGIIVDHCWKKSTLDHTATPLLNGTVFMLCEGGDVQCHKQNNSVGYQKTVPLDNEKIMIHDDDHHHYHHHSIKLPFKNPKTFQVNSMHPQ